jgi:hypothetical protein
MPATGYPYVIGIEDSGCIDTLSRKQTCPSLTAIRRAIELSRPIEGNTA